MNGEDEQFNICNSTYPEEATIECLENRQEGFDVWIRAVPCNNIKECRNGKDEDYCNEDQTVFRIIIVSLIIITQSVYLYLRLVKIRQWKRNCFNNLRKNFQDSYKPGEFNDLKGDDLTILKVNLIIISNSSINYYFSILS